MSANLLGGETSPYLLQHKDNPVHWRPWGEAAFEEARAANKPILLSVGYAACHWCHVMAHESFENAEVAALMNEAFVCVKVDREERPDVDQIYQHALALLGQQGGWPLTMFCTPDGDPFWGGTYFPYPSKYGRPGFDDVLRGLAAAWRDKPADVETNRAALKQALARLGEPKAAEGGVAPELLDQVAARLAQEVDRTWGGIGKAPKFPNAPLFELLWRAWLRGGRRDAALADAVTVTLDRMCQGGVYDHLGGGFARYATDDRWLIPHFEKMLYDNAQLVRLLTLVWQETKSPLYAQRIAETCDWMLREMTAGAGAQRGLFAASYDADSEGEEGRFYVWDAAEIEALLGADSAPFKQAYDVSAAGNWEHRTILHRNHAPALLDAEAEARLAASRAVLKAARDRRTWPGWDDKALADWNGMAIAALAFAGATFGRSDWLVAARRAFEQAMHLLREPDGRLRHSWRNGTAKHVATLDDYAMLIDGALMLHEAGEGESFLERALDLAAVLQTHYGDGAGGYFYSADDAADLIVRAKHCNDAATPSGNGVMLHNLARLWTLTGEEIWRTRADALVRAFAGELDRNFFPLTTLLNGVELLDGAIEIVVVGEPDDPATRALIGAVYDRCLPNRVLRRVAPDAALPESHPAAGKGLVGGRPAAYVCRNMSCSAPATTPEALAAALR